MMNEITTEEKYIVEQEFEMWLENGLVYAEFIPNSTITIATIQKFITNRNEISQGKLLPFLINLDNVSSIHYNSLTLFTQRIDDTSSICKALYASTPKGRILTNIIANNCQNEIITKDFDTVLAARDWIENFKLFNF